MSLTYPQPGPVTDHIKQSLGGPKDPFNHYGTEYNVKYGRHWINRDLYREPRPGGNFMWSKRSCLGYNLRMDDYDNPHLKPVISRNYMTVTQRDYRGLPTPSSPDCFYDTQRPIVPVGYNYRTELTMPRQNHNPDDWKTTYSTQYDNKPPKYVDLHRDPIGRLEPSGFTLNAPTVDTLNGRPHSTYRNDWPRTQTDRPTGVTVYTTDYRPYSVPDGSEPLPNIAPGSDRSSGYVMGNKEKPDFVPTSQEVIKPKIYSPDELKKLKKSDPAEYFNAIHPKIDPSVTHATFTDPGQLEPTKEEILNQVKVGEKEDTGFTRNQNTYVESRDDPTRFITHYMTQFYDPSSVGAERNGHIEFNVNDLQSDGFVKNNGLQNYHTDMKNMDPCPTFRDAYQQRSFDVRDYVAR